MAIGTLVYSFAATAFGGFGSGFSALVVNAGQQLSENLVVEQAYFFTNNTVNCVSGSAGTATGCGGVLYVRNVGVDPVAIEEIYMTNITAGQSVAITTESTPATCTSQSLQPGQVCFVNWDTANLVYDTNNILPMSSTGTGICASPYTSTNEIAPNCVDAIRFNLPPIITTGQSSPTLCASANWPTCVFARAGTVYSFLFVTARGNQFVVYEKA